MEAQILSSQNRRKRKTGDSGHQETLACSYRSFDGYLYTRAVFGLLLCPVATCNLADLLEDVDWLAQRNQPTSGKLLEFAEDWMEQKEDRETRLHALGVIIGSPTISEHDSAVVFLKKTIGCIASAVAYLHESDIKHKDLKPSNILLSRDGLWLTDFDTATDFSVLTSSITDNGERGTPKYFAPEVARFAPSGRAADVFSMGCIFFEIMILCIGHTLRLSMLLRAMNDKSFQSNLDNVEFWLVEDYRKGPGDAAVIDEYLLGLVRSMMDAEAHKRPTAGMVERDIALISGLSSIYDSTHALYQEQSVHRDCCYQEMFPTLIRNPFLVTGLDLAVTVTTGKTCFPSPFWNNCSFYVEFTNGDVIQAIQIFAVSTLV
jgi:hypothetical protein